LSPRRHGNKILLICLAVVIVASLFSQYPLFRGYTASAQTYQPCNCAVFRLDDLEDNSLNNPMVSIMDQFISHDKQLNTDIIVSRIGNVGPSGKVLTKIQEGHQKGLFELGIHGWDHIKYWSLTEAQQRDHFTQANSKLQSLFGDKSRVFGAPFNAFDSNTIKAMAESGLDTLSTGYDEEAATTNIYKVSDSFTTDNSIIPLSEVTYNDPTTGQHIKREMYHVPFSVSILNLKSLGYSGDDLTNQVISMVKSNIAKYGFSLVILHPDDVAFYDSTKGANSNIVDSAKLQGLADIINRVTAEGISFGNFGTVTPPPTFEPVANDAPIANAGYDTTVKGNNTVMLDGSGSKDPDGTIASYRWTQVSGDNVSLSDPSAIQPTFVTPTVTSDTKLSFVLTVTDDSGQSANDTVIVNVKNTANNVPPVAKLSATSLTLTVGESSMLDAGASFDLNGDPLNYTFTQTSGTNGSLVVDSNNSAKATFIAPSVASDETATIQVTVTDDSGASDQANVAITVKFTRQTTTLVLNPVSSVPWGKNIVASGKLTIPAASSDEQATGIGGATITFDGTGAVNLGSTTTKSDGTFTVVGAPPAGTSSSLIVQAHYAGDPDHRPSSSTTREYSTTKHSVLLTLSISSTSLSAGQTFIATTTLKDSTTNALMSGKNITFTADSPITIADQTTDSTGKAIVTLKAPPSAGTYAITAHFAGDSLYTAGDSSTVSIAVNDPVPVLVLNSLINVAWGKDVVASGKLTITDANGVTTGIAGATITFDGTGASTLANTTTGSDGTFNTKGTSPNSVATGLAVQAHFAGDSNNNYPPTNSAIRTYSTTKHNTGLTVTLSPTSTASSQSYTVSTALTDSTLGIALSGKTLTFAADSPITIADQTTDSTGKTKVTLTAPFSAGTYNIQAHLASDDLYVGKDSTVAVLSVTGVSPVLVENSLVNVPWGGTVKVTGRLTTTNPDGTSTGIGSAIITFDGTGTSNIGSTTTGSDGTFTASGIAPTSPGTGWAVQAHYAGDSANPPANSAIRTYSTTKHNVALALSVSPTLLSTGETYTVTATLKDSNIPISGKTLTFAADSPITIADQTTDSTGKTKVTLTAPFSAGTYNIQAHLASDDLYNSKDSSSVEVTVTGSPPTLTLNSISNVAWGKDVTVTGKLTTLNSDGSTSGIDGATITFDGTGASNLASTTTGTDGSFTAKGASPSTVAAAWKVQGHYAGNTDLQAANSLVKTYDTTKHSTTLTLSMSPTTVSTGQSYTVTTTLRDSTINVVLAGKTITFTADSPITIADQTTDSTGKTKVTLTAPFSAGTYNIQGHNAGDDLYSSKDSSTLQLTVTNTAPTLTLNSISNVAWGKDVTVTGKLTTLNSDGSTSGIDGATITFDGDGAANLPSVTTSSDGSFTAKGASPSTVAAAWKVQGHYAGDSDHKTADSNTKTYSTTKHNTALTLTVSPTSVSANQSYTVSTTFRDSTINVVLAGKTITFTADSPITIADQKTDSSGKTKITLDAPHTSNTYDIKAAFNGDDLYNVKDSSTITLTVH
jgi:peptidoglycan/xylan/chitin deacetylase (PgdA/CDA1 family)